MKRKRFDLITIAFLLKAGILLSFSLAAIIAMGLLTWALGENVAALSIRASDAIACLQDKQMCRKEVQE